MASSSIGHTVELEQLDGIDRAAHARFVAVAGSAADFLWPDAELNARLGCAKQKRARDARRKDNERRLSRLEAGAVASPLQAQSLASASPAFTWADGVRERELHGHEAPVMTLSIDGALLASKDSSNIVKVWDLRSAECVCTLELAASSIRVLLQGDTLAVSARASVQLWHARVGKQLCELTRGYIGWMRWCGPSRLLMLACDAPLGGSGIHAQTELWSVAGDKFQLMASAKMPGDHTTHCLATDVCLFVHAGHKAMHVWSLPKLAHQRKIALLATGRGAYWPDALCYDLACTGGTIAAIVSSDGVELQLWNAADGTCTRRLKSGIPICVPGNLPGEQHTLHVVGGRIVYLERGGKVERVDRGERFFDLPPLRVWDVVTCTAVVDHTVNSRLAWRASAVELGDGAIASTTYKPQANQYAPAHGEDRSHVIKLFRPSHRGTNSRTFNEHERLWDADQHALAAQLQCLGLQHFATSKFLQVLEDRGYCSNADLRGICISLPFDSLPMPRHDEPCLFSNQFLPDGQRVSIRDPQEHGFLGLTAEEANRLADGLAASATGGASSSRAQQMQDRRRRVRAQAEAGNAEANELMDRDAVRHRTSRKRVAEAANTGDEAACERLTAERERIEARLPQHTADSRRERRRRVSQRAHVEGSAAMAAAAEEQLANERNRGRQRREK